MTQSRVPVPSRVISQASSSREDSDSRSIPLQSLNPRLSTETQRRNGYRQSTLPDRGDRICEDLRNGNYECGICSDKMNPGNTRQYSLWQCRECYNVSHLLCVNTWWRSNGSQPRWSCPYCFHHFEEPFPNPSCWCGKQSFNHSNIASSRPNACLGICDRIGQCRHGGRETPCPKLCHPGPCNIPCTEACLGVPLPRPPRRPQPSQPPRPPNAWNRFCTRVYGRGAGSIRCILGWFSMIAILYGAYSVLLFYYIKWWMRPYEYYVIARTAETIVACVGCIVVLPVTAFLCAGLGISIADFLVPALNLNSAERHRGVKLATKFIGFILLVGFCIGFWILPIIGFTAGPGEAWNNMMKDSCNGFSTRINMDTHKIISDIRWITKPRTQFSLHTYTSGGIDEKFYLGEHLRPLVLSNEPFQHYYRLSGQMNHTGAVAVDVDFQHQKWRIMHLNQTDETNKWLGKNSMMRKSSVSHHLPQLHPISEKLAQYGKFDNISDHMQITELGLGIQNMRKFLERCENEPFLRVFDTSKSKNKEALDLLMRRDWHDKNQEAVVMRTASFGHSHARLDMCMKETDMSSGHLASSVMREELLVPFTIVSALRLRGWETDLHTFNCDNS